MEPSPWPLLIHPVAGLVGLLAGIPLGGFLATCSHRFAYDDECFDPRKGPRPADHVRLADLEDLSGLPWHHRVPFLGLLVGMIEFCHFYLLAAPARCDDCGVEIPAADRRPMLGYLRCRGRCRGCAAAIPRQHFVIEALTPLATGLIFAAMGPTYEALMTVVVCALGLVASVVDWNFQIIPDEVPTTGIAIGLGAAAAHTAAAMNAGWPEGYPGLEVLRSPAFTDPWHLGWACMGGGIAGLALWAMQVIGARLAGTSAMGSGDVKLVVALGLFVGPEGSVTALLYAINLGAVCGAYVKLTGGGKREEGYTKFAFGPYLCFGYMWLMLLGAGPAGKLYMAGMQALVWLPSQGLMRLMERGGL